MNIENQNNERNEEDSLNQLREQAHILEALRLVISDRKIVEAIRMHCDEKATKDDIIHALCQAALGIKELIAQFNLDKVQVESILNISMSWDKLHNLISEDLEGQYNDLMSRIAELEEKESSLISSENK